MMDGRKSERNNERAVPVGVVQSKIKHKNRLNTFKKSTQVNTYFNH